MATSRSCLSHVWTKKNLFEIVQNSADFEKITLKSGWLMFKATSIQINADDLTPEKMAEFEQATKPVWCFFRKINGDS